MTQPTCIPKLHKVNFENIRTYMSTPIKYAEDSGIYTKKYRLAYKTRKLHPRSNFKGKKQHLKCLRPQLGVLPSQALAVPSDTSMNFNMAID